MVYTAGTSNRISLLVIEMLEQNTNLLGSTVTYTFAVDNPGATPVPIQIEAFTSGDATTNWSWSHQKLIAGRYAAAAGFQDWSYVVADYSAPPKHYCASATIQVEQC